MFVAGPQTHSIDNQDMIKKKNRGHFQEMCLFSAMICWKLGCLEVLENYEIQQKFRRMTMQCYKGFYI